MKTSWVIAATIATFLGGCTSMQEDDARHQFERAGRFSNASSNASLAGAAVLAEPNSAALDPDKPMAFKDALAHAWRSNPRLIAAYRRWEAALARVPQARSLEDPDLTFEYMLEQRSTLYQAQLTQTIPLAGKLGLKDRMALAETRAAMHDFESARLAVYDRVVKSFHEYVYLGRSLAITEESVALMGDLEKVGAERYKAGAGTFSDLIKAQVEKEKMASELASMKDERKARSAALASALNLPVEKELPLPLTPEPAAGIPDETTLISMLRDLNPDLKAKDSMIERDEIAEKLADRRAVPDLMVGARYEVMAGENGKGQESDVGLMAGITLPIWPGRYRAAGVEARATREATIQDRNDTENQLRADLVMAVARYRDAERRLTLYRDSLLPKAQQVMQVSHRDFAGGKISFAMLLDAQRTLLEFQRQQARAFADHEMAVAEIGCCVGSQITVPKPPAGN